MLRLLDKVHVDALLLGAGLWLSTATQRPANPPQAVASASALPQPPAPAPAQKREARPSPGRPGAESEELASLRRAEDQMFGDDLSDNALMSTQLHANSALRRAYSEPGAPPPMSRNWAGQDSGAFWSELVLPDLGIPQDPRIERYIRYFSEHTEGRQLFETWLRRSGRYRGVIFDTLRKHGLPDELIAIVFVESGFGPTAVSTAGATGLWQLMPRTARAYGLAVSPSFDERRGIWRSSEAAARHLTDLHKYLGAWDLALAAYNCGHERLRTLSDQMGTDDFWVLSRRANGLPRETALYVPKVLAVSILLRNLERFGFGDTKLDPDVAATPLEVAPGIRLSMVARASGTSLQRIRALNPEIRNDVTPNLNGPVLVHLPASGLARARVMLPRLIDDAERDLGDLQVAVSFDWGRDDLDSAAEQRLMATTSDEPTSSRRAMKLDRSKRYFGASPLVSASRYKSRSALDELTDEAYGPPREPTNEDTEDERARRDTNNEERAGSNATAGTQRRRDGRATSGRASTERAGSEHAAMRRASTGRASTGRPSTERGASRRTSSGRDGAERLTAGRRVVAYTVNDGDTLGGIAQFFGVRLSDLLRTNDLRADDLLRTGTKLRVSVAPRASGAVDDGEARTAEAKKTTKAERAGRT